MTLSIVIPARNAEHTLPRVLTPLLPQLSEGDEVIVVDDGSTDATGTLAEGVRRVSRGRLTVLRRVHQGPAAARNAGLAAAAGDLVLFLGADTVPAPTLVARHRALHRQYPQETVGCLGFVTWDPALPPSPFMVWLEHGGSQNAYGEIAGETKADPRRFLYAANLSLKRALLKRVGGFDAAHFPGYGWEDTDLGLRLAARGFRLCYEPTARAWHAHSHTIATFLERQRAAGRACRVLGKLHPDRHSLTLSARGWRWSAFPATVRRVLLRTAEHLAQRWIIPKAYGRLTRWAFTDGVHAALAVQRPAVEKHPPLTQESIQTTSGISPLQGAKNQPWTPSVIQKKTPGTPHDIHRVVHKG